MAPALGAGYREFESLHHDHCTNMKSLDAIGLTTGTDKNSQMHNYCEKYQKYLPFPRTAELKILEIGVQYGKSINMWSEFYANAAVVVGIDINPECKIIENPSKKIFVEIGSQSDKVFLNSVATKYGPFDLIIDDGSHMQSDVILSFDCLFPSLRTQGVYIIEDTCCAYWPEFCDTDKSSVEYMKSLVDHVHFFGQKLKGYPAILRREDLHVAQVNKESVNMRTDIESINFMNSTILVTKR